MASFFLILPVVYLNSFLKIILRINYTIYIYIAILLFNVYSYHLKIIYAEIQYCIRIPLSKDNYMSI